MERFGFGEMFRHGEALGLFLIDESGATAIEYGLIASLIAVVLIVSARTVGTNLSGVFGNVAGNLQ